MRALHDWRSFAVMSTTWTEQAAELAKLRIENESLRAQLISLKGATKRSDLPRNWDIARAAMKAILIEDAARDGFDARTPEGHQAWWNWRYPDLARAVAEAQASGRLPASPGGKSPGARRFCRACGRARAGDL